MDKLVSLSVHTPPVHMIAGFTPGEILQWIGIITAVFGAIGWVVNKTIIQTNQQMVKDVADQSSRDNKALRDMIKSLTDHIDGISNRGDTIHAEHGRKLDKHETLLNDHEKRITKSETRLEELNEQLERKEEMNNVR